MADPKELQKMVDDLSHQVAENFHSTLSILTTIVSLADRFHEGSHCKWVSDKSADLAKELGMKTEDIFEIRIAGLLHDIGKLGFPDSLLQKVVAEMVAGEYKEYAFHPEQGMQLLKPLAGFDSIGEIIYQHHERLNGSGFPRGLQYRQIHPGAAIIAIVDTYHNGFYKLTKEQTASGQKNYSSSESYLKSTKNRFATTMNFLHRNIKVLFDGKAVDKFTEMIEFERKELGQRIVMRTPVANLAAGMIIMEDFYSSYGLLICSRGETVSEVKIKSLVRFAENGEIPMKILVMK